MNDKEIKLLVDYVKKRYDEVSMDYKLFDGDIDTDLTYVEQKRIIDEKLSVLLPKLLPKLKRECSMPEQQAKLELEKMMRLEQEKQEAIAKEKFEKEIELIVNTKTSEELERLYFKPNEYIKMVASGREKGLLLYGESSLGKSYRVKKVLSDLDKKEGTDYYIISGHITPLQFFTKLFQAKDKIVVFDDVNILESKINLNMLKASLNENSYGKVEYHTSKKMPEGIPSSFIFTGKVIILLNDKPKNSEHLRAVENRILTHHLKFSYEEIIRIIFDIAKQNVEGVSQAERFEVVKWLKDNTNRATKNLNIRLYQHTIRFYKWNKEYWKELATNYIQNDEYTTMIIQGITDNEWVEKTGMSLKTKQRLRAELGLTRSYPKPR
jgi:hypothetical protein